MSFYKLIRCIRSLPSAPCLLGLSGGPDSMALFHLLLEEKREFHVAHIDHAWRDSSAQEAEFLKQYCLEKKVAFHLCRLSPPNNQKNLEDKGRKARLAFFRECIAKEKLSSLILAHHADDQAESVLKRVLESAFITNLSGLKSYSKLGTLTILRPFLGIKKDELLQYLSENAIPYFEDATNQDPRFLRGKMRQKILPQLSKDFGKNVPTSLCRLGKQAQELSEFMDTLLLPILATLRFEENGISHAFDDALLSSSFFLKAFLRKIFALLLLSVSENTIEAILFHLQKNDCKVLEIKGLKITIKNKEILFTPKTALVEMQFQSLYDTKIRDKMC